MKATCRPMGRLFLLLLVSLSGFCQTPPLTTINDVVYRGDGQTGQGTLLISWPGFTTAAGQAVVGGATSTVLGPGGTLSVSLVPNQGATPASTVYTVVYQLSDMVKTEYWVVPSTTPATLAEVRVTLGASSSTAQMATQQYVNSAVSAKANDVAVVHLEGNEAVLGVKQFASPPQLPAPTQPMDGVNKQYVDEAVQNVGSGSYLSLAGGTLTGPLTLSSERNDVRRGVYDKLMSAAIAFVVSAVLAMHDHFVK
jgi:hypothetical protein